MIAKQLSMRINQYFFDENTGFYCTQKISQEKQGTTKTCTGELLILIKRGRDPEG